jgi:hypothetical protein
MDLSKYMLFQLVRLVGAVGIEPTTFGLKVGLSLFPSCGISELHSRCSVELRLFGLIGGVLRTFSVPNHRFRKTWAPD